MLVPSKAKLSTATIARAMVIFVAFIFLGATFGLRARARALRLSPKSAAAKPVLTTYQQLCARLNNSYPLLHNVSRPVYSASKDLLTSLPKYGPEFEPKGKLRVVAINSEPTFNKYMCDATVFSAAVNSIPLEIYGAAPYYSHMMKGKDGKIDRMLSVMCAMDPADVVLMVDAYDVIFQRPFAEMEYLYHHKWQSPNFVISTESNCFPQTPEHCEDDFIPKVPPSGIKYINSGIVLGKVDVWIQLLNDALEAYRNGMKDDQFILTDIVFKQYKTRGYFLDHNSELSASPHPPAPSFGKFVVGDRNYFVSAASKTVPMIVHLNGGSSRDLISPWDMWYFSNGKVSDQAKNIIRNYEIAVDGVSVKVRDACPTPEFEM
ncbi:hypothetical protein HDU82_008497 [Entophlyctis luteolus]|nr:hypothetical protein HDU82_008497 [Entophlyctis luteolus]KAJ3378324.1 hypothetical protein HDU84_007652 [Entophlyctis sp. JEL0112]